MIMYKRVHEIEMKWFQQIPIYKLEHTIEMKKYQRKSM